MATELDEISALIDDGKSFLLSGGAGSGKTFTLVQVLRNVFEKKPSANVACITYTNVAVKEILERTSYQNLHVSTIHDFLWDTIKSYQKNLKQCLFSLIEKEKITDSSGLVTSSEYFYDKSIDYREWRKISEGIISHDEVILLAEEMFCVYPALCDIVRDKYDFILVDEYQDTSKEVINILLNHLQKSSKKNVLGFFGDSMQAIYGGNGDIQSFIDEGIIYEVVKKDNRRNPKTVIDLANQLRTDSLVQQQAEDENAPNYGKSGSIKFLYSDSTDFDLIKSSEYFSTWDFSNTKETKELYLTHNLIAPKAGFPNLMAIFSKDRILEYKNSILRHIKENNIQLEEGLNFGQVIDSLNLRMPPVVTSFVEENQQLYMEARSYPFDTFKNIYLDSDQLIGNKKGSDEEERKKGSLRNPIIKHLFHIQDCIFYYANRNYNDFIRKTHYRVTSLEGKRALRGNMNVLRALANNRIQDIIDFSHENGIWLRNEEINDYIEQYRYVYNRIKEISFSEFHNCYLYIEGFTPFSTQHNIKGAEFDDVFIVLDNGRWNKYNFKNLFLKNGNENVLAETEKLFYVCCTRAKRNLVVFYHNPEQAVLSKAEIWFGKDNVKKLS
ncbi:UvrD-helicase domain-containing protein [Pedobacter sp. Du54]|uniref:UvrD-helicase domain-containing protein n=1 Tax=Pedobacter anseongensis TaxID=3133439 RepID=UPI0030B174A9